MSWFQRLVGVLFILTGLPYLVYLILYVLKWPKDSPIEKEPWEPSVSIVLPTYNEEDIVESKLENLLALNYPMEKVELVVVDSSNDGTVDIINSFFDELDHPDLNVILEEKRRGLAVALNEAYEESSNEVVVKTDCDSKVAPNALRHATANLSHPDVSGVTGRNAEVLGGSEVERGYRDIQAHVQMLESHLDSTLIFHGPFSAFERDAIVPIDQDSIADDSELALKIRRGGSRVVFDPEIEYKEASHSGFKKRRQQKDRRAMGLLRLLWRQQDMIGGYGLYGRIVLPFNWWFMFVTPWMLAVIGFLSSLTAIGLLGPVGLVIPGAMVLFVHLGSNERLGDLQSAYALLDTQFSLARAGLLLLKGEGDGTWTVDKELREAFEADQTEN